MKKKIALKNAAIAVSLTLTIAFGVSVNTKPAWAGYLSTPTLSTTPVVGAFPFTINNPFQTAYATANSSYGNTIPTGAAVSATTGISPVSSISDFSTITLGTGGSVTSSGANVLYDGSNLGLSLIASSTNPYTASGSTGSISGDILSQVFEITSGNHSGDLVFTYQFDVTAPSTLGASSATIGSFNNPTSNFALGEGINASGVTTTSNPTAGTGVTQTGTLDPLGSTLPGTVNAPSGGIPLIATVFFTSTGSAQSFDYELASGLVLSGDVSAQIFVASDATNFGIGSMSVGNSGISGFANVFVPATPEPSTLVLLGTGLCLLTFLAFRKRQYQSVL